MPAQHAEQKVKMRTATEILERYRAFIRDDRGAAAIVIAFMLPILIAGLAFGAEVGFWELQRRKLQNTADMAAHSAAMQLRGGISETSDLKEVAVAVATFGGYEGGDAGATLETPPTSGAYNGDTSAVRIFLQHSMPRRFSGIFSSDPIQFTVTATALIAAGDPACVLALHPSASGAVSIGGSTNVDLDGCNLAANSTSSSAIEVTGNAASLEADCVSTPGDVDDPHGGISLDCGSPMTGTSPVQDPYQSVPEPPVGSCSSWSDFTKKNKTTNPAPGCYSVSGNEKVEGDVVLSAGTYIFSGSGEVRLNGGASITGTDVTLFFDDNISVKVNGSFDLDIKAPTSGTYSGIAIFGSRSNGGDLDLTGNSGVAVVGAIYAPDSDVEYTGNTTGFSSGECTQVIGGTVTFWGSAEFDTDCSNSGITQVTTAGGIQLVE